MQDLIPLSAFTLLLAAPPAYAGVRDHPQLPTEGMVLCSSELENSVSQEVHTVDAFLEGAGMGSGPCSVLGKGSALPSNQ